MTPTKSLEPREVAIRGDQFTAVLDGQGCHVSLGDQRALNGVAHFHKQVPVCATRHDEDGSCHSTSLRQNTKAVCIGVAGRKILGFVTILRKPASMISATANGSGASTRALSHAAYRSCSGAACRCA